MSSEVYRCKSCGKIFNTSERDALFVRTGEFQGEPLWSPACSPKCAEDIRRSAIADINREIEKSSILRDIVKKTPFRRLE